MAKTDWFQLLGYVTELVNQELLLKNEYLVAENRILKAHIRGRYGRSFSLQIASFSIGGASAQSRNVRFFEKYFTLSSCRNRARTVLPFP
jgi:hypothetical protein